MPTSMSAYFTFSDLANPASARSAESRRLGALTQSLHEIYGQTAHLIRKDRDTPIHGPLGLLQAIFLEGEKGLSLQRYKGLGEMNPEQLWETTLDPSARTMLQVRIEDLGEADDIFTKLMGDVVEPRRDFIQQNALQVANQTLLLLPDGEWLAGESAAVLTEANLQRAYGLAVRKVHPPGSALPLLAPQFTIRR